MHFKYKNRKLNINEIIFIARSTKYKQKLNIKFDLNIIN